MQKHKTLNTWLYWLAFFPHKLICRDILLEAHQIELPLLDSSLNWFILYSERHHQGLKEVTSLFRWKVRVMKGDFNAASAQKRIREVIPSVHMNVTFMGLCMTRSRLNVRYVLNHWDLVGNWRDTWLFTIRIKHIHALTVPKNSAALTIWRFMRNHIILASYNARMSFVRWFLKPP